MKVMVIVKATPSSEAGELPGKQLLAEMGQFNEQLVKAGIMQAGEGLKPSSQGVRVHFNGSGRMVTDGPFTETRELIAGFWLWNVGSIQEAVDWVRRCPNPMLEESVIEIRPLYETDDFSEVDFSGELRKQEEGLRDAIALRESTVQSYLFFAGRCEEALQFYQQALNATVGMVLRFSESPDAVPEGMLQEGFQDKIMHAEFTVGKTTVMVSDGCDDQSRFGGFRLALTVPTTDLAERVFGALADQGTVDMPLMPTFWSPSYGMVTDRFGVGWMVMVPGDVKHGDQ